MPIITTPDGRDGIAISTRIIVYSRPRGWRRKARRWSPRECIRTIALAGRSRISRQPPSARVVCGHRRLKRHARRRGRRRRDRQPGRKVRSAVSRPHGRRGSVVFRSRKGGVHTSARASRRLRRFHRTVRRSWSRVLLERDTPLGSRCALHSELRHQRTTRCPIPGYSAVVARQREFFLFVATRPTAWRKAQLQALRALFIKNQDELSDALWTRY